MKAKIAVLFLVLSVAFGYRITAGVPIRLDSRRTPNGFMASERCMMPSRPGSLLDVSKWAKDAACAAFGDSGWNVYTGFMAKEPVYRMTGKWPVPRAPEHWDGQTLFYFNGLEDGPHGDTGTQIIQPVLQYGASACGGGAYWALSSWYVSSQRGKSSCSDLIKVNEGDIITGDMIRNDDDTWQVIGYATTPQGQTRNTTLHILPDATEWWPNLVLETYGCNRCSQYSPDGQTVFANNTIAGKGGSVIAPQWEVYTPFTDCNQHVDITQEGAEVTLYY